MLRVTDDYTLQKLDSLFPLKISPPLETMSPFLRYPVLAFFLMTAASIATAGESSALAA